jgi:hypothetical protein
MVLNRQDIGDRGGSHIPLTALGVDDEEFDRVFHRVEDLVDLRRTTDSKTEYFVVAYDRTLQWLYDAYGAIGGDIMRGWSASFPAGRCVGPHETGSWAMRRRFPMPNSLSG